MVEQREVLTDRQVLFEVSFAVGQVPRSVWVRVRGKDRLSSDKALEEIAQAIAARFSALEVVRFYDPDKLDWRNALR